MVRAMMAITTLRDDRRNVALSESDREQWTRMNERAVTELWQQALADQGIDELSGVALAAVGSLGRRDAGPESDLDLVLIHDGGKHPELTGGLQAFADSLWYPIWDANVELDHSVRSLSDCRTVARADLAAGLAMLDLRYLAGDEQLVADATSAVLTDWRRASRMRFSTLVNDQVERRRRFGRLPYLIEGDLKEAAGGMRDALLIKAIVASWLAERPAIDYVRAYHFLLDVRDALTLASHRHNNVLRMQYQDDVAAAMGFAGETGMDPADELLSAISQAARTIRAAYADTVRRAKRNATSASRWLQPRIVRGRKLPPHLTEVAPGVGERSGELVLTEHSVPGAPRVLFRMASAAALRELPIRPATLQRMHDAGAGTAFSQGYIWPAWARADFESILSAGRAQISVWEQLDMAGLLTELIPAWASVRNLPQRSAIHRHTVDRHQIEATANLVNLVSTDGVGLDSLSPARRSVLLLATFFHDIGKRPGVPGHAARGAQMIPGILTPMGYGARTIEEVALLVKNHLVMTEMATSADPSDPATIAALLDAVNRDSELLTCLHILTQADASSCKEGTWDDWKAGLVANLVTKARAALS